MTDTKAFGRALQTYRPAPSLQLEAVDRVEVNGRYRATALEIERMQEESPLSGVRSRRVTRAETVTTSVHPRTKVYPRQRSA